MTYSEALSYIHKTDWKGSRLGLERIERLLYALGDPQKSLRFIHVAGTNGKGSVSVMLASVLQEAGYRVGLFTSPFLLEFRERIRISGAYISEAELIEAVEAVRPFADAMEDSPTEFELMTALAFWYFREKKCDLVVCEVGLGGELDSTNVIENPLLSVITSIGLDHTRELGERIEDVARAKAGIIKPFAPVLFGEAENAEADAVLRARAEALCAPYHTVGRKALSVGESTLFGTRFSFGAYRDLSLSLCGAYQPINAASVLSALPILAERGVQVPEDAVRRGLSAARWPGRFEVLSRDPVVIADGAHNPHGAAALCESLDCCFGEDARFLALVAVMADKDYRTLLAPILRRVDAAYCTAPEGHARALDAKKLAAVCDEFSVESYAFPDVKEAVANAVSASRERGLPLLIFGSLYLYREASEAVRALL